MHWIVFNPRQWNLIGVKPKRHQIRVVISLLYAPIPLMHTVIYGSAPVGPKDTKN